jgi:hypothetical protein
MIHSKIFLDDLPPLPETKSSPEIFRKKTPKSASKAPEFINTLQKINTDLSTFLFEIEAQINLLKEKLVYLEDDLLKGILDSISSIKKRITLISPPDSNDSSHNITSLSEPNMSTFMKKEPIILNSILNNSTTRLFEELQSSLGQSFFEESLKQLQRFLKTFNSFHSISNNFLNLNEEVKSIFDSTESYFFTRNINEIITEIEKKYMSISIKCNRSIIVNAFKNTEVRVINSPSSDTDFYYQIDSLFNPKDLPILIIPIDSESIVMVIHTNQSTVSFCQEDILIGQIFADLILPLVNFNRASQTLPQKMINLNEMTEFSESLSKKTSFIQLIPFLQEKFKTILGIEDLRLFFSNENFYTYSVHNNQLIMKIYPKSEIPVEVYQNKRIVSYKSFKHFNKTVAQIDLWIGNNRIHAFPILSENDELIGILSFTLKQKLQLSNWSMDFILSNNVILSLLIP